MRVLLVHPGPHFSVADVYNGLHNALLAAGCEVATLNLDDRLEFYVSAHTTKPGSDELVKAFDKAGAIRMASQGLEVALYEFWPDVVIVVSGWFVPETVWQIMAQRPHTTVLWATESPYEDDQQATIGRWADICVLNDPANIAGWVEHVNPNTYYQPHSYDPNVHYPGQSTSGEDLDFVFIGTGFPSRIEWFERVDWSGLKVGIGGQWKGLSASSPLRPFMLHDEGQCVDNRVTADLYRASRMSANLYRREANEKSHAVGWAMGPREVELAACGTFFFRDSRGEGDTLFPYLPPVPTPEKFGDELRWWLAHPDARAEAIGYTRDAILDRTFANAVARLLDRVDASPASQPKHHLVP